MAVPMVVMRAVRKAARWVDLRVSRRAALWVVPMAALTESWSADQTAAYSVVELAGLWVVLRAVEKAVMWAA